MSAQIGAEVSGKRFWETASVKEVGGNSFHSSISWFLQTVDSRLIHLSVMSSWTQGCLIEKRFSNSQCRTPLRKIDKISVTLDGRVLKTPAGNPLTLPKDQKHLALLIAGEWHGQKALLKSHSLPMVTDPLTTCLGCYVTIFQCSSLCADKMTPTLSSTNL